MAARITVVTVTTRMVVMPGEQWRSAVAILKAPGSLQGDVAVAIGRERCWLQCCSYFDALASDSARGGGVPVKKASLAGRNDI
jgi:hypothetical protein